MPNWTQNTVTLTGNEVDVKAFMKTITNDITMDEDEVTVYELTECLPMPKVFETIRQGARTFDDVRVDAWFEDDEGERPMLDITKQELTDKHGTYEPIDWQYRNWGTKWGDCDTRIIDETYDNDRGKVILSFDSAWGEPFLLLNHIARKYDLTMTNVWDIELGNGNGTTEYPWDDKETQEAIDKTNEMHDQLKGVIADMPTAKEAMKGVDFDVN